MRPDQHLCDTFGQLYRAMEMQFWLPQAQAALTQMG
jgi:hypothetical protein